MNLWLELKRVKFKLPCFLFEEQLPKFAWNGLLGIFSYRLHDLLCPEMWMIRIFPNWLSLSEVIDLSDMEW